MITRGTTGVNRLRRSDRWTRYHPRVQSLLHAADSPLAVDVGYGASHTTTVEWARWLRQIRPDLGVVGLEIDPARVLPPRDGVRFELGGFELAGYRPHLVRAFNVLRQYDVDQVPDVWDTVRSRLASGGLFIEGTCDELGRRCAWLLIDASGPQTLTLSWDPHHTAKPSDVAERLPKALIHHNVPGERVHGFLTALDAAWISAAPLAVYGHRQRWIAMVARLRAEGWPVLGAAHQWRRGEVSVAWDAVRPDA